MNKYLKIFLKFLAEFLIFILLLLLCLRLSFVQTKLANIATNIIAKNTNTVLRIDKVAINFVDNVSLKGIYAEDTNKDTLLYAGNINVDLGIFNLLRKKVDVENVNIDNIVANVYQKEDSTFNFQFLIDAFASSDTIVKDTSKNTNANPFEVILGQIDFQNADLTFDMLQGKNAAKFKQLLVSSNSLDLENLVFDIAKINIVDAHITTQWQESTSEDTTNLSGFPLNDLPVTIICNDVEIENSNVLFTLGNAKNTPYFEANYINVESLNLEVKDILVCDSMIHARVKNLAGNLNDKLKINKTEAEISFGEKGIFAENFILQTSNTNANLNAKLTYKEFDELVNLSPNLGAFFKVENLALALADLVYFVPQIEKIEQLKNNLNDKIILSSTIKGSLKNLNVDDLNVKLSNTNLKFVGIIESLFDYENLKLKNTAAQINTNVTDLEKYLGNEIIKQEYKHFGNIFVDTEFDGTLQSFKIEDLTIVTEGLLQLNLKGEINEILDVDKLNYAVDISNIETGIRDLSIFTDSLPELLNQIEFIAYKGFLEGNVNSYNLVGDLTTNLGEINSDLYLNFNENFSNATYKGQVGIEDFSLGQLLQNDSLGKISLTANVNGSGLSLDSLNAALDAKVALFQFNNYSYKDLTIDGSFVKQKFDGKLAIKDDNLDFDFTGLVDFNDSIPILNFKANLDKFYAKKLNLMSMPLFAKLKIDANLKGITAEDIVGNISIKDVYLENGKQNWQTDSIVFFSDKTNKKNRQVALKSDLVNIDINGNYSFASLPQILLNFGNEFFPFSTLISQDSLIAKSTLKDEFINARMSLKNIIPLAQLFELKLEKLDSAILTFKLDAPTSLGEFKFFIPEIKYSGIYADSIFIDANTKNNEALLASLKIDSINYNDLAYIPDFKIDAKFFEQKANISTIIKNSEAKNSLNLTTVLEKNNEDLIAQILSPLILNTKKWQLVENASYNLSTKENEAFKLKIKSGNETLSLNNNQDLFSIVFGNFDLSNIINLIQIDSTEIKGAMNGNISLGNSETTGLSTDLNIGNIRLNDLNFGNLKLVAKQLKEKIDANLSIKGNENNIKAEANYNLESGFAQGNLNIVKFSVATIEPVIKAYARNLSGILSGKINFSGINAEQDIDGKINMEKIQAFVIPVGTNYEVNKGTIKVEKDKLQPNIILKDLDNNTAKLAGTVGHNYFTDFTFDLNFTSDKFTFLNAEYDSESLFFGKVIASSNISVKGDLDMPVISGFVSANDGSDVTLQLLSPKIAASQEAYIVFVDGKNLSFNEIEKIANERYKTETSVDVDIVFNISEKTNLKVIIDPLTGDNLQINGNARLAIKVPPYGDIDINGSYTVTSGSYRFSFQQVLRKKFEIVNGSSINFTGNPLEAALNLKAAYRTDISTYALVAEQSAALSDEEKRDLKRKTEAKVLLEVDGKIIEPKLSFDIVLNENSNSPIGSSVTRALNRIKQNESELNKQVFSLLLFNSFTSSESSGNISSAGTSTAARSVGNLINTQLNKLTNNVDGLQLNFDLDQYEDQFSKDGDQITEIDVGLSQSLLNDRLTISIDGNLGLETGNESAFSSIAGDFVLAYNITRDGKYKVRVFQKSDFDALNNSNVWKTGFGFSYQAKFGKLKKIEENEK